MGVSEEAWNRGMLELALLPAREESDRMVAMRAEVYRRELQPYLTDHEWTHAVSEVLRSQEWFPTIYLLADLAKGAPLPPNAGLLPGQIGCEICRGTGWEIVERSDYPVSKPCPNGCRPPRLQDMPRIKHEIPQELAVSALAKVQAICREKVRAGQLEFRYPGIDEDIVAEDKSRSGCRGGGIEAVRGWGMGNLCRIEIGP